MINDESVTLAAGKGVVGLFVKVSVQKLIDCSPY